MQLSNMQLTGFDCIGKALETYDQNLVIDFEPIESQELMDSIKINDLNIDQKYFY